MHMTVVGNHPVGDGWVEPVLSNSVAFLLNFVGTWFGQYDSKTIPAAFAPPTPLRVIRQRTATSGISV